MVGFVIFNTIAKVGWGCNQWWCMVWNKCSTFWWV